ncbi:MAG: DUF3127 domain-containing protein [Bacteroidales bacterium]|mgnify:CR=1 FL=1|nr:DUF3127 domain-containing protein [Bacteroidales bacterium]
MEIVGKVVRLGNLTEGQSARGPWRKQELIIETEEQYPRTVCLICWTNQIEEIQHFAPGQTIKAQIEISSREFNGKWYTDVRVWRFDPVGATAPAAAPAPQQMHQTPPAAPAAAPAQDYFPPADQGSVDDLPF